MQALAISSFPSAPPAAFPSVNSSAAPTDAQGVPAFAQVVHDALNSVANSSPKSSGNPPAASSSAGISAKGAVSKNILKPGKGPLPTTIAYAAATTIGPVLPPDLLAISQSLPPTVQPAVPNDHVAIAVEIAPPSIAVSGASEGCTPMPLAREIPDPRPKDDGSFAQTAGLTLADQIATSSSSSVAPPPLVLSSQVSVIHIPSDDTPASPSAKALPDPGVVSSLSAPDVAAPAVVPPPLVTPPITPDAAAGAARASSAQTFVSTLLAADSTAPTAPVTNGQAIASLLPQLSKLQGNTPAVRAHVFSTASTYGRLPSLENLPTSQAQALTRTAPPGGASRPPMNPVLPTAPKGLQLVANTTRTPAQAQDSTSGPNENNGSQEATSSRKDTGHTDSPAASDASTSTPAVHDASSFSQALVVSPSDKQDAAPPPDMPAELANATAMASTPEHASSSPAPISQAPPAPASSTLPPQNADAPSNRFVDSAKLVEAAGHSEMRIAMDTDKLGPLELRARMVGDEVGAAITVEKRDAHAALAVELPALQQALSDKQLRVEQVTLLHGSLGSTAGDAGASAKQDQRSGSHSAMTPWSAGSAGVAQDFAHAAPSGIFDAKGRLSVHA